MRMKIKDGLDIGHFMTCNKLHQGQLLKYFSMLIILKLFQEYTSLMRKVMIMMDVMRNMMMTIVRRMTMMMVVWRRMAMMVVVVVDRMVTMMMVQKMTIMLVRRMMG